MNDISNNLLRTSNTPFYLFEIQKSRNTIVEKILLEEEIQTLLAGPKNELNLMMTMPFLIVAMLRAVGGGEMAEGKINIIVNGIALVFFVLSYEIGRKMVDIRV